MDSSPESRWTLTAESTGPDLSPSCCRKSLPPLRKTAPRGSANGHSDGICRRHPRPDAETEQLSETQCNDSFRPQSGRTSGNRRRRNLRGKRPDLKHFPRNADGILREMRISCSFRRCCPRSSHVPTASGNRGLPTFSAGRYAHRHSRGLFRAVPCDARFLSRWRSL